MIHRSKSLTQSILTALTVAAMFSLGACATPGDDEAAYVEPIAPRLPPTQVYFYPAAGQTPERQERDRYDCYLWAVRQTGFDPSQPPQIESKRVEVIPVAPPGEGVLAGAFSGAILGAAVSRPREASEHAVLGAILGAAIGAAAESSRQGQAMVVQQRQERRIARGYDSQIERQANDYRRAMAACLEGRGYTVH
jgi:hypothetical protein